MNKLLSIYSNYLKIVILALFIVAASLPLYSFTPAGAKVEVVRCYPNPATSFVNFEFQKNIDKSYVLQVYSFVGKKMVETSVNNNKITVALTDFNRGIYIFQLRDKNGETVVAGKFQVIK